MNYPSLDRTFGAGKMPSCLVPCDQLPKGESTVATTAGPSSVSRPNDLLDPPAPYESLASRVAVRRQRWSAYVHQQPPEDELSAIRRASATGLPYGAAAWINRLSRRLNLNLTIRPRGRPRKSTTTKRENSSDPILFGAIFA